MSQFCRSKDIGLMVLWPNGACVHHVSQQSSSLFFALNDLVFIANSLCKRQKISSKYLIAATVAFLNIQTFLAQLCQTTSTNGFCLPLFKYNNMQYQKNSQLKCYLPLPLDQPFGQCYSVNEQLLSKEIFSPLTKDTDILSRAQAQVRPIISIRTPLFNPGPYCSGSYGNNRAHHLTEVVRF